MALSKEQKARLKQLKEERIARDHINALEENQNRELEKRGGITDRILKKQDEILKSTKALNDSLKESGDLEAQILENQNSINTATSKRGDIHKQVLDVMRNQASEGELSEKQAKSQTAILEKIAKGELDINEIKQIQKDNAGEMTKEFDQFLNAEIAHQQVLGETEGIMGSLDGLTGGMAGNLKDFSKLASNPAAMGAAVFAGLVAILVDFSGKLDAIGEEFGAIGVQQFAGDLMAADAELARIGMSAGTAASITTELADNFGVGMDDAMGMAVAVGDMSKALGLSATEGAQLMGMFTTMGGMSPQQAEDTAKMAAQLANANNVNPSAVLKDIAGSTETFAKFGKDGGKNLVEAAVVAKKLGTNLDSVASTMEAMLDFGNSTTKAMEASVMLGRDINVQKLQELSLSGDAAGVLEEQKRLLGDAEKFNSMNVIQRKALAEALGLSVEEANKMVNAQEDAASLAGELAKQPGFEELVGKEAISSLTQLMGSLTSIAAVLTNVLGPPLNIIIGIFAEGFNVINSVIDTLMEFPALAIVVGGALALMSGKFIVSAIAGVWAGVTSIMSIPFVGPVLAGIAAAGLISSIYKAIAGAESQKVGDAFAGAGAKGPVITTPQGQSFEGSVRDEVLMAPGIAGAQAATATAGGGGNSGVVEAINNLNKTTQSNKPPSAKDIGKKTTQGIETASS